MNQPPSKPAPARPANVPRPPYNRITKIRAPVERVTISRNARLEPFYSEYGVFVSIRGESPRQSYGPYRGLGAAERLADALARDGVARYYLTSNYPHLDNDAIGPFETIIGAGLLLLLIEMLTCFVYLLIDNSSG